MTHTQRRSHKAALALGAVLAITPLAAPAVVMPTAIAEESPSPLINFTKKGSLSLANRDPKLVYKLWKVEEWTSAADVKSYSARDLSGKLSTAKQTAGNEMSTETPGQWAGLPLGVYIVEPTEVENDTTSKIGAAKPFFVYVPTTDPTNLNAWTYNVSVTLKDNRLDTTKIVSDDRGNAVSTPANADDTIYYTVTGAVPQNPAMDDTTAWLTKYEVKDDVMAAGDANLKDWAVKSVTLSGTDAEGETQTQSLEETTDYTVANGVVSFNATGLGKIAAFKNQYIDAKVKVVFGATVNAVADTDGAVNNTANVTWRVNSDDDSNHPSNPDPTDPTTSTPVTTKWVKIRATKVDNADTTKKLAGAQFSLYKCTVDESNVVDRSTIKDANKLTVGDATAFATDTNGALYIDGVNQDYGKVCLVETKAPKDYELNDTPIVVDLTSTKTKVTATTPGVADTAEVSIDKGTITNVKSRFPSLPITGGVGIAIFAALAAGIAAATVWATRRAARRS